MDHFFISATVAGLLFALTKSVTGFIAWLYEFKDNSLRVRLAELRKSARRNPLEKTISRAYNWLFLYSSRVIDTQRGLFGLFVLLGVFSFVMSLFVLYFLYEHPKSLAGLFSSLDPVGYLRTFPTPDIANAIASARRWWSIPLITVEMFAVVLSSFLAAMSLVHVRRQEKESAGKSALELFLSFTLLVTGLWATLQSIFFWTLPEVSTCIAASLFGILLFCWIGWGLSKGILTLQIEGPKRFQPLLRQTARLLMFLTLVDIAIFVYQGTDGPVLSYIGNSLAFYSPIAALIIIVIWALFTLVVVLTRFANQIVGFLTTKAHVIEDILLSQPDKLPKETIDVWRDRMKIDITKPNVDNWKETFLSILRLKHRGWYIVIKIVFEAKLSHLQFAERLMQWGGYLGLLIWLASMLVVAIKISPVFRDWVLGASVVSIATLSMFPLQLFMVGTISIMFLCQWARPSKRWLRLLLLAITTNEAPVLGQLSWFISSALTIVTFFVCWFVLVAVEWSKTNL